LGVMKSHVALVFRCNTLVSTKLSTRVCHGYTRHTPTQTFTTI
jgi:hypothetical protein